MQKEERELVRELRKLNQKLAALENQGRFMIYSAHPIKFALYNLLAGIFHTLGSLAGYVIIGALVVYLLRGVNLSLLVSRWLEESFRQIRWDRVLPQQPTQLKLPESFEKMIK